MFQNGEKMEASIRTLVIYTSIPCLAIAAASSILVSIPPVVSCVATDISTAVSTWEQISYSTKHAAATSSLEEI
jgi:hypothetical protein